MKIIRLFPRLSRYIYSQTFFSIAKCFTSKCSFGNFVFFITFLFIPVIIINFLILYQVRIIFGFAFCAKEILSAMLSESGRQAEPGKSTIFRWPTFMLPLVNLIQVGELDLDDRWAVEMELGFEARTSQLGNPAVAQEFNVSWLWTDGVVAEDSDHIFKDHLLPRRLCDFLSHFI